ncbi:MAG: large conductance mechanosensitive channel protein MscL [Treponema sp.]|nr:large conductance mechanosensitive channel protein MscL [Treponema sp.]MCL2272590.1 large conductance mechanosensitive channel protein MscL [Treponema sp.]
MFKKFLLEFKEFALRGNVMSLAVGLIIGSAFQGVVNSLTDNILSPIIGLFAGQNFDYLELSIFGINLRYGAFITSVINFIIMAFIVFMLIRTMNKLLSLGEKEKTAATSPLCPYCKTKLHPEATRCPACTSML